MVIPTMVATRSGVGVFSAVGKLHAERKMMRRRGKSFMYLIIISFRVELEALACKAVFYPTFEDKIFNHVRELLLGIIFKYG